MEYIYIYTVLNMTLSNSRALFKKSKRSETEIAITELYM